MPRTPALLRFAGLTATALSLSGCLAATAVGVVAGTAVGVTGAAVGATAKGAGMVVGAVIPDGDEDERRR